MIELYRPHLWAAMVQSRIAKRGRHEQRWYGTDTYTEIGRKKTDGRHMRPDA